MPSIATDTERADLKELIRSLAGIAYSVTLPDSVVKPARRELKRLDKEGVKVYIPCVICHGSAWHFYDVDTFLELVDMPRGLCQDCA